MIKWLIVAALGIGLFSACSETKKTAPVEVPAASPPAVSRVYQIEEAGLQLVIPAGWGVEQRSAEQTAAVAPDGSLAVIFRVAPNPAGREPVVDEVLQQVQKSLQNVKVTERGKPGQTGGVPSVTHSGTGEMNGLPMVWRLDLIEGRRPVAVYSIADQGALNRHRSSFEALFNSITKTG